MMEDLFQAGTRQPSLQKVAGTSALFNWNIYAIRHAAR